MSTPDFMVGNWFVYPRHGFIENEEKRVFLEPKLVDVLVLLVENSDDVVSIDLLLERCWPRGIYGDNPLHKAIAMLRKALGDDAKSPRYIATVRKRGYRLVAPVLLETMSRCAPTKLRGRSSSSRAPVVFDRHVDRPSRRMLASIEAGTLCEGSHSPLRSGPPRRPHGRRPMKFLYRLFSEPFR